MLMKNHTVLLTSMLFLLLGIAATLQAQENPMPEFADPVSNPFGLVSPSDLSNAIIRLKLVDINHDGTLEAFVRSATIGAYVVMISSEGKSIARRFVRME